MELSASEIKEALHAPSLEGISLVHGVRIDIFPSYPV